MTTTLNYYGTEIVCEFDIDIDYNNNTIVDLKNVFVEGKNVNGLLHNDIAEDIQERIYENL